VLRIHLPALRARQGDIRLLLDHFFYIISSQLGKKIAGMSRRALDVLLTYQYPGNVRELRNIVEYAVHICRNGQITPQHLPSYLMETDQCDLLVDAPERYSSGSFQTTDAGLKMPSAGQDWSAIERQMIIEALFKTGGRKSKAAELLGWARSTLWRKIKQHRIHG
jgi:DNA-binding NtrC family response regulator